jgi:SecD/SecF fusion protein
MFKTNWKSWLILLPLVYFIVQLAMPLLQQKSPIDLGLDLAGGVVVTYRPDFSSRLDAYADSSEQELLMLAKETIRSRLSRNLNAIPDVVVRNDQRIVVSLPGGHDYQRVLETVGKTYHLTLRLVLDSYDRPLPGKDLFAYQGRYLELAAAELSGDMLDEGSIRVDSGGRSFEALGPAVLFRFSPPHDQVFAVLTGDNVGRQLAILLDDQVEWCGVIESEIDGYGLLRGDYSLDEAQEVALMLRSSMPLSLAVESVSAVGPGLGEEIYNLGWQSLLLSLLGLTVLLGLAYLHRGRLLLIGLVSLAALLVSLAGLAATFNLTLDLAGVAGLILSIGIGMDAFLIVFESLEGRLAERRDQKLGRSAIRAIYSVSGEGRTLFHANVTTLVVIMLLLGSERLRSFALFILIGVCASVLTILLTRQLLSGTAGMLPRRGPDLLRGLRRCNLGLFRLRLPYLIVIVLSLVVTAALAIGTGGPALELDADFRPGTQLVVSATEETQVEAALHLFGERHPEIDARYQRLGHPNDARFLVTISAELSEAEDAAELQSIFGTDPLRIDSLNTIDGRVSSSRLLRSCSVLVLSFLCLAVYFAGQGIAERIFFSRSATTSSLSTRLWVFAGTLLAVLADLAVVVVFMVHLRIDISLPVVAAVLTIIGYSVNDSVVLWSHIQGRWTSRLTEEDNSSPLAVVTSCVDRILSRTLLTSLSTMLPAVTILMLGLTALADFAWVMIAGTLAGTLSSIFIVGIFARKALEHEQAARAAEKTVLVHSPAQTA